MASFLLQPVKQEVFAGFFYCVQSAGVRPVVEPFAGFCAEVAAFESFFQCWRQVGTVAQVFEQIAGDVVEDIQATQIGGFERTGRRQAARQMLHGGINGLGGRDPLFDKVQRFAEECQLEAVGDETESFLFENNGFFAGSLQ